MLNRMHLTPVIYFFFLFVFLEIFSSFFFSFFLEIDSEKIFIVQYLTKVYS